MRELQYRTDNQHTMWNSSATFMTDDVTIRCRIRRSAKQANMMTSRTTSVSRYEYPQSKNDEEKDPDAMFCDEREMICTMRYWEDQKKAKRNGFIVRPTMMLHQQVQQKRQRNANNSLVQLNQQTLKQHKDRRNGAGTDGHNDDPALDNNDDDHQRQSNHCCVGPELLLTAVTDVFMNRRDDSPPNRRTIVSMTSASNKNNDHCLDRSRSAGMTIITATTTDMPTSSPAKPSMMSNRSSSAPPPPPSPLQYSIPISDIMVVDTSSNVRFGASSNVLSVTTLSMGIFQFDCYHCNAHDILLAFLQALLPPERILDSGGGFSDNLDIAGTTGGGGTTASAPMSFLNFGRGADISINRNSSFSRFRRRSDGYANKTMRSLRRTSSTRSTNSGRSFLCDDELDEDVDVDRLTERHIRRQIDNETWPEKISRKMGKVVSSLTEISDAFCDAGVAACCRHDDGDPYRYGGGGGGGIVRTTPGTHRKGVGVALGNEYAGHSIVADVERRDLPPSRQQQSPGEDGYIDSANKPMFNISTSNNAAAGGIYSELELDEMYSLTSSSLLHGMSNRSNNNNQRVGDDDVLSRRMERGSATEKEDPPLDERAMFHFPSELSMEPDPEDDIQETDYHHHRDQ